MAEHFQQKVRFWGDVCETHLTVAFGMRNASIWREAPVFVVG
jgi:hypothetical protein